MEKIVQKLSKYPDFPIYLVVIICLIAGMVSYKDFGQTWDEPLFYSYADAIPSAYSISARLNGTFDINNTYGAAEDHKRYGPAYLLLAKPFVDGIVSIAKTDKASAWHFINFVTFQVGVLILYFLARRWVKPWAAFGAATLFATQPVLWGHAFINPKDLPFTVFFIATIYCGFAMVDHSALPDEQVENSARADKYWKIAQVLILILFAGASIATLMLLAFSRQIQGQLPAWISAIYNAPPDSFIDRTFALLTFNGHNTPVDAYIKIAIVRLPRIKLMFAGVTMLLFAISLLIIYWRNGLTRIYRTFDLKLNPWRMLAAGILLGLLTSIRILGPFAGLLISIYYLLKFGKRALSGILIYGIIAIFISLISWPYLWISPSGNFLDVLAHMSNNPQGVPILFNGKIISSLNIPPSYLPIMLGLTLTISVWPLFLAGLIIGIKKTFNPGRNNFEVQSFFVVLTWFFLPFLYAVAKHPPMYDGFRHFMFIVPPIFLIISVGLDVILPWLRRAGFIAAFLGLIILPGVFGIIRTHPYEYAYYNEIIGGVKGAFRRFETDYWLTCYKSAIQDLQQSHPEQKTLFVLRNSRLATYYSQENTSVQAYHENKIFPGSYLLLTSRANNDLTYHPESPAIITISKNSVPLCIIRQIK
jgi:4-amino-4-deoxy-L-arabinose transferase-like glycosyltransferase